MYELKMALFDNNKMDKLFLFVWNYKTMIEAADKLTENEKLQCVCTLLRGQALCKLGTVFVQVGTFGSYWIVYVVP